ncbi:unnamed protein product [Amoebophrya sp. A25]|nr:unnamed protein product [Amoebophrya sp. A25]|eukprot:GSA25T00014062001.1
MRSFDGCTTSTGRFSQIGRELSLFNFGFLLTCFFVIWLLGIESHFLGLGSSDDASSRDLKSFLPPVLQESRDLEALLAASHCYLAISFKSSEDGVLHAETLRKGLEERLRGRVPQLNVSIVGAGVKGDEDLPGSAVNYVASSEAPQCSYSLEILGAEASTEQGESKPAGHLRLQLSSKSVEGRLLIPKTEVQSGKEEDLTQLIASALEATWFKPVNGENVRRRWGSDPLYVLQFLFLLQDLHEEQEHLLQLQEAAEKEIVRPLRHLFDLDVEWQDVYQAGGKVMSKEWEDVTSDEIQQHFLSEASAWTSEVVSRGAHKLPHLKRFGARLVGGGGEEVDAVDNEAVVDQDQDLKQLKGGETTDTSSSTTSSSETEVDQLQVKKASTGAPPESATTPEETKFETTIKVTSGFSISGWGVMSMRDELHLDTWISYLRRCLGLKPIWAKEAEVELKVDEGGASSSSRKVSMRVRTTPDFSKSSLEKNTEDAILTSATGAADLLSAPDSTRATTTQEHHREVVVFLPWEILALGRFFLGVFLHRIREVEEEMQERTRGGVWTHGVQVPLRVRQKVQLAGKKVQQLVLTAKTDLFSRLRTVRQILYLMEEAARDESMTAGLYFSGEFTAAVYLPIVLPALIPFITFFGRAIRAWKHGGLSTRMNQNKCD